MGEVVNALLQPYTLFVLLTALGLSNLWRGRRESRRRLLLAAVPFAGLWVLSMPVSGYLALGSLEWQIPPRYPKPGDVEAVVVLAGNVSPPEGARARAEAGHSTVYRCVHAAELYRRLGPLPVLACGGPYSSKSPAASASAVMRDLLVELGVAPGDVLLESDSRTTHGNALGARKVLGRYGPRRVVLVTEASHMPRALRTFRKQGFAVVPSPCRFRATRFEPSLLGFVPTVSGAQGCLDALHEWLGLGWYRLRGRIA